MAAEPEKIQLQAIAEEANRLRLTLSVRPGDKRTERPGMRKGREEGSLCLIGPFRSKIVQMVSQARPRCTAGEL
jgi:hypothetical protein